MTSLVIAEHDNASIRGATLNTVTAAVTCGGDVPVLVAGHNAVGSAQAAAQIAGVAKVIHADSEAFAHGLAENVAAKVLALASNYGHILFPATATATASGKNIAPRVAAKLDVAQISDHQGQQRRHLRAPDLRRQRDCHRAKRRPNQGAHRAHHRLRRRALHRWQCPTERSMPWPTAARAPSSARKSPRATARN